MSFSSNIGLWLKWEVQLGVATLPVDGEPTYGPDPRACEKSADLPTHPLPVQLDDVK